MRFTSACVFLLAFVLPACLRSSPAVFDLEKTIQVTNARARAQTTRSSGRCLCIDADGNAHMAWEDGRYLNAFEIFYTSAIGDSVLPEIRLTRSHTESSYPAIACDSADVYIVWEETMGHDSEIYYVHLRDREEVARIRVTDTNLDSSCPVCAVGPDGAVHLAWHEGPFQQTAVYYAKVVDDSIVATAPICTKHPEAFRPDIACDGQGRILIIWFEGMEVKSRFWDGVSWGEEQLVGTNLSKPWRLSVASLRNGTWAAVWFHRGEAGEEVFAKFWDGTDWYDQTKISRNWPGYYPNVAPLGQDGAVVAWEERVPGLDQRTVVVRCYDGENWGDPLEIYQHRHNGRYASVASHGDLIHAMWFSGMSGSNEIYYARLRKR
jgi:hypothetical protein